jgi:hypothetical protein
MSATVEVTQAVESFDGQGQHGQEPADQQTVGMMMTDMLEAMTALGHAKLSLRTHGGAGEIRQPVGFDHRAVRLVLAIEEHARGFPVERLPGIEQRHHDHGRGRSPWSSSVHLHRKRHTACGEVGHFHLSSDGSS